MTLIEQNSPDPASPTANGLVARFIPWGLGAALVLTGWVAYSSYAAKSAQEARIADLRQQHDALAGQLDQIQRGTGQLTDRLTTAAERAEANAASLEEARRLTDRLQRVQQATARTAAANATAVQTVQQDLGGLSARVSDTSTRASAIATDVASVATRLTEARTDIGNLSRDLTTQTTRLSGLVMKNADDLAALRLKGERDFHTFDIGKGTAREAWTVADVRIQLTKTDVKRSKYDVIVHADDRQVEKKERTMNEPVPFLVGSDLVRYELVVTAVEKDRIRGYLSVPKDRRLAAEQPASQL